MLPLTAFCNLLLASTFVLVAAIDIAEIFQRPVITRIYESGQYTLANTDRSTGNRVDIATVASSLAGLKPSYVCSLIRLEYGTNLTADMVSDFNTIRSAVLAVSPNAKFDVELNLDPHPPNGQQTYPNAAAVVSYMEQLDSELKLDGWWFDYYSTAQKEAPDWVVAVTEYAHNKSQTVGGNVWGGIVPPSSDAVAFVDDPNNSTFGFGFNPQEVTDLKHNSSSAVILGHLNCNPQNGNTTESCVYMYDWNSTWRADYLDYWVTQEAPQGFTYMLPLFFPLCPGAYSFDPLSDVLSSSVPGLTFSGGEVTLYDYIQALALGNSSTASIVATSSTTSPTAASTHTSSSFAQPSRQVSMNLLAGGILIYSLMYVH